MSESKKVVAKRRPTKGEDKIRKIQMFKETANNAISDATEFDKAILESNEVYVNKLCEADNAEYEILKLNMEKAESDEERAAIRKRIAEMQKERYAKDTENKQFYERQQESHRNHNMKILGSLAVVSGLVYTFRKPLAEAGNKLITKI